MRGYSYILVKWGEAIKKRPCTSLNMLLKINPINTVVQLSKLKVGDVRAQCFEDDKFG